MPTVIHDPSAPLVVPARLARYGTRVRYSGGAQGLGLPLGGGVRYSAGRYRGRRITERRLGVEDRGELQIGADGLRFLGRQRCVVVPRQTIVRLEVGPDAVSVFRSDVEDVDIYFLKRRDLIAVRERLGIAALPTAWWRPMDPTLTGLILGGLAVFLLFPQIYARVDAIPLWLTWLVMIVALTISGWAGKVYPRLWVKVATFPLRVLVAATVVIAAAAGVLAAALGIGVLASNGSRRSRS